MNPLPLPTTMSRQSSLDSFSHPLSNQFEGMAIERQVNGRTLPSIHELFPGSNLSDLVAPRRSSNASSASGSSLQSSVPSAGPTSPAVASFAPSTSQNSSYRRAEPAHIRLGPVPASSNFHYQPYPTPQGSPEMKSAKPVRADRAVPSMHAINTTTNITAASPVSRKKNMGAAKAGGKKRGPRTPSPNHSKAIVKADREKGARHEQCEILSKLQNQQLRINPKIAELACRKPGRERPGWRELKSNNVNSEIKDPLAHNKTDVMETAIDNIAHGHLVELEMADLLTDPLVDRNELACRHLAVVRSKATDDFHAHFAALKALGRHARL